MMAYGLILVRFNTDIRASGEITMAVCLVSRKQAHPLLSSRLPPTHAR